MQAENTRTRVLKLLIVALGVLGVGFGLHAARHPGSFGPIFSEQLDAVVFSLLGTFYCILYLVDETVYPFVSAVTA